MSDQCIIFSPERNQWTLADGRHHMEVPEWAREIMRGEFERETRPLRDNLDLAIDSKRIAERRVTELLDENAKLRELMVRMAEALGIDSEWADPNWCKSNCVLGFGCWPEEERTDIRCPAWAAMQELGIEVDDA